MNANNSQVGGTHYQRAYQHWDFVCDSGMHYLLGNATKYVVRWRVKGGVQDLEKSKHYLQKAQERKIYDSGDHRPWISYCEQLENKEDVRIMYVILGCCLLKNYDMAIRLIDHAIATSEEIANNANS